MKLNELYTAQLATFGLTVDSEGYVSKIRRNGVKNPATIGEKRVVLPVEYQLGLKDWSNRVVFHPLYEAVGRGESETMAFYRNHANSHLNVIVGVLAVRLLELASSPAEHSKLDKDQSEFVSLVKHADEQTADKCATLVKPLIDEQTMEKFIQLLGKLDGDRCLLNIYVKKGGMLNKKKHSRVAVVSFPLYEELAKADKEIFGIKLRAKARDKETLMSLLEYFFPRIATPQAYDAASDSSIAPTMDSFMHAVNNVIGDINNVIATFNNLLDEEERNELPTDWLEAFDNLGAMKAEIYGVPLLPGNEGSSSKLDPAIAGSAPASAPVTAMPAPVAPPVSAHPAMPTPVPAPAPMPMPMPAPFPAPVAPPGSAAPYRPTGAPVEFSDLLRNNPLLATGGGKLAMGGGYPQQGGFQQPALPPGVRPVGPMGGYPAPVSYPQTGMHPAMAAQQYVQPVAQQPFYPNSTGTF